MDVVFMNSKDTMQRWGRASQLLMPAIKLARGDYSINDLQSMTECGKVITALVVENEKPITAIAFEFAHYPQTLTVNIIAIGGRSLKKVWYAFSKQFQEWCRMAGASKIEVTCGSAMARMLSGIGFAKAYEVVEFDLMEVSHG